MKEDLAEWLNNLYPDLYINVNNFMDRLDTGVALCEVSLHSNIIITYNKFCDENAIVVLDNWTENGVRNQLSRHKIYGYIYAFSTTKEYVPLIELNDR